MAALGIGGEWAVGASLLSETWPSRWRPWLAAVLQSAVNVGILLASVATFLLAGTNSRVVFLVGVLPAWLVFWIRREVPETDEWQKARAVRRGASRDPDLFGRDSVAFRSGHSDLLVLADGPLGVHVLVSATPLYLPDLAGLDPGYKRRLVSVAMLLVMVASIVGNFAAAWLARLIGDRRPSHSCAWAISWR